jgi:hypothetical protein
MIQSMMLPSSNLKFLIFLASLSHFIKNFFSLNLNFHVILEISQSIYIKIDKIFYRNTIIVRHLLHQENL